MPHRGECLSPSQPLPIPIYSLLVRAIPPNGELLMIGKIDAYTLLGVEAFFSADFGISRGSCPYEVSYNRYERVNTRVDARRICAHAGRMICGASQSGSWSSAFYTLPTTGIMWFSKCYLPMRIVLQNFLRDRSSDVLLDKCSYRKISYNM